MSTSVRPIDLVITPTSCADLWGHIVYRNTVNCFTSATTIGFTAGTTFKDTNVTYATTYFYWVAPVDFSFNVGSWTGPATGVASHVVTTDISCGAVSGVVTFANVGNIKISGFVSADTIGFVTITTQGGPVLVVGGFDAEDEFSNKPFDAFGGIDRDAMGNNLVTRHAFIGLNNAQFNNTTVQHFELSYIDPSPSSGSHTYYLTGTANGGATTGSNSLNIKNRNIQAVELKR